MESETFPPTSCPALILKQQQHDIKNSNLSEIKEDSYINRLFCSEQRQTRTHRSARFDRSRSPAEIGIWCSK